MDRETLLKILDIGSLPLSLDEIEKIMDEEMEKDSDEMDGELIEMCADILEKAYFDNGKPETSVEPEKDKRKTRIKLIKVLVLAAIILILFSIAIPACAKYIKSDVSDKIVKFYSDHFEIDLRGENNDAVNYSNENTDIIKELNDIGIENVILPKEFLKDEYIKTLSAINEDNNYLVLKVDIEKTSNKTVGYITIYIHKTSDTGFLIGQTNIDGFYDSVKQITVNGMDIIVFSQNEQSFIEYIDNSIEYEIHINNCDFDSAIQIANSLN